MADEKIMDAWLNDYESWSMAYGFKQSLSMPGMVLSTNAMSRQGRILTWEFQLSSLLLQDYVLEARSRQVHPWRIVLAISTLLLVAASGALMVRRRRK